MSQWALQNDDNEEDEIEIGPTKYTGREGTIYLIDKQMTADEEAFQICLECIEADLLKGILVNARDLVSVVFYNTEHSPPSSSTFAQSDEINAMVPNHCAIFIPLMPLSKDLIQYFKNFRNSDTYFDIEQKYGTSSGSSFYDAFWLCSRLNIRCTYSLINCKVLLFTQNEQPYMPGSVELQRTLKLAKDFLDNNMLVDLIPMIDDFNMDLFYKEFLCEVLGTDLDEFRCNTPKEQQEALLNRVFRKNFRKSCLRHLTWNLTNDLLISCDLYSFTRSARKPNAIRMFRDTGETVIAKRCHMVEELTIDENVGEATSNADESNVIVTERKVLPGELFKSQTFAGKEIVFRADELIAMKSITSPGLNLLGFKSLNQLKPHWMIRQTYFMYPSENKIKGSTTLFRTLWNKCLEKKLFALCVLTMQRKVSPKYVALVPQTQELDGNDGFRVIYLPTETNVSHLPAVNELTPEFNSEQIELMGRICKKLKFKYRPDLFANPSLLHFYTKLEALVYDDDSGMVEDNTCPRTNDQDAKIGDLIPMFEQLFGQDNATAAKRTNDANYEGSRPKSSKNDLSDGDILQAIREDRIAAVTVAHLKEFIRNHRGHVPANAVKKVLFETAKALID